MSFARERDRVITRAWKAMTRNQVWIPFGSLNGTFGVFTASDASLAYAQSYAMVEMLKDRGGTSAIATAVQGFRQGADTQTVLARICGRSEVTGGDLLEFL